ncbi:MAG: circadian clock KaiB family protein [Myxococcota bacterium]
MTEAGEEPRIRLRLYVAGEAPNSQAARANLASFCEALAGAPPRVEVIDVFEEPLRAHEDGVILTPTLLRVEPEPVVRVAGSLGDRSLVRRVVLGVETAS